MGAEAGLPQPRQDVFPHNHNRAVSMRGDAKQAGAPSVSENQWGEKKNCTVKHAIRPYFISRLDKRVVNPVA